MRCTALTWLSVILLGLLASACGPSQVASLPAPTAAATRTPTGAPPAAAATPHSGVTAAPTTTPILTVTVAAPTLGLTATTLAIDPIPTNTAPPAATAQSTSTAPILLEERQVGGYTIRLWKPAMGIGLYNHATLSAAGQVELRVEAVTAIGSLPVEDVTGDGFPDVMFKTYAGGSHCCWGTVVYSLGPTPEKALDIVSPPDYYGTGSGTFADLDADNVYEFITRDPLTGIPCTAPAVKAVLRYVPGQGYVGASFRFPDAYADDIAAHRQRAEQEIELSRDGYKCGVYELLLDYLYTGQTAEARQELERLYLGPDLEVFWSQLQQSAGDGRFYATP